MAERPELVALGVVARPHGVRGELRVHPFNPESDLLFEQERFFVRTRDGATREATVVSMREGPGGVVLLSLEGVTGRDAAEGLRGAELCVPREAFPETESDDEWYAVDLVGLRAKLADGTLVGEVVDVIAYPTIDCLRVRGADGDREVPIVDPYVERVDIGAGEVIVGSIADLPIERPRREK